MSSIWFCLGFLAALILATEAELDKLYKIPLLKCEDADDVKEPKLKVKEMLANVTFVDDVRHYGPPNCDYVVKFNFTAADTKNLTLSIILNGKTFPDIDGCKNITPPCSSDGEKDYIFTMGFPAAGTKGMNGDITALLIFKKGDEKLSCARVIHYFFQSSCCY